jgi:uncharacterized surface anchored protein
MKRTFIALFALVFTLGFFIFGMVPAYAANTDYSGTESEAVVKGADSPFGSEQLSTFTLTKQGDGGEPLSGVSFALYSGTDELITVFQTDENGETSLELPIGVYYIVETATVYGYRLMPGKTDFEIDADSLYFGITLVDSRELGRIQVVLTDTDNNALLSDAVFGIYDAVTDERVGELITDSEGIAISEELPVMEHGYYLIEEKQPDGYSTSTIRIPVMFEENETAVITMTNTAISPATTKPEPTPTRPHTK